MIEQPPQAVPARPESAEPARGALIEQPPQAVPATLASTETATVA